MIKWYDHILGVICCYILLALIIAIGIFSETFIYHISNTMYIIVQIIVSYEAYKRYKDQISNNIMYAERKYYYFELLKTCAIAYAIVFILGYFV
jgi:hypothetical protein